MDERRGLLLILSSPSGAGKSALAARLVQWDPDISFSVSATTRRPRPGEVDGRDYRFLSAGDFQNLVDDGEMLEHAEVFGNRYGTPSAPVRRTVDAGRDVLFDVDWQGAEQIRNSPLGERTVSIFILPPSIEELRGRLIRRGQDSEEVIADRMRRCWDEIRRWEDYEHVLVNEDLDATFERLKSILLDARAGARPGADPGARAELEDRVRRLRAEFDKMP